MSSTSRGVEFRRVRIPDSLHSADAADFVVLAGLRNAVSREVSGHDDHARSAAELLPGYRPDAYELRFAWIVLEQGRPIGYAGVDLPLEADSRVAYLDIGLLREAQGRGIGAQASALIERTAREHGRTVLQTWAEHPETSGDRLRPPTGFGSVPSGDRTARFLLRHGYALEQIERCSAFDLRGDWAVVESFAAQARAAASGYRVVSWTAPTPADRAEGYGWMKSRMITDTPAGALEFDEEVWDAARVARHDALYTDAGRLLRVVAAESIATGELCAFSELSIGADRTEASHQNDTLVLSEHRGHRLGMLLKCENLLAWRDIAPASPRVITYNAEENRPMLDINEALGFRPIACEGAWKKVIAL